MKRDRGRDRGRLDSQIMRTEGSRQRPDPLQNPSLGIAEAGLWPDDGQACGSIESHRRAVPISEIDALGR